jgi:hypothetical protein
LAILAILVATSGTSGGGGGGGIAPKATGSQNVQTGSATTQQESVQPSSSSSSSSVGKVSNWATGDYETDLERLKQELSSSSTVGENARDASSSTKVKTSNETYDDLKARGFDGMELQSSFSIDGSYHEASVVDKASTEKYPSYGGSFFSSKGVLWNIYLNEGEIFAVPVGSTGTQITKHILLTELDHVIQYDGVTNQYSDWQNGVLPDGSKTVQVARIDRDSLDSYSVADIEAL